MTAYVYIISKNFGDIVHEAMKRANPDAAYINKWYFGLGCFLIYVPLVMVRKINKLAVTHIFGDVMIFVTLTAIVVYGGLAVKDRGGFSTAGLAPMNYSLWPDAIGFSVYAYEGIGVILPI